MPSFEHDDIHVELAVQLTPHGEYVLGKYASPLAPLLASHQHVKS